MSFKNIIGQDRPIAIIGELMRQSRFQGGYLFAGPEGLGKKLIAIELAKALNCEEESLESCEHCPSCVKINKHEHPDIHLVSVDEETDAIKIESIRQLQKDIFLKPYEAKVKVFIIDNAHNLTAEAANALLKVLEEPPKSSLIILITALAGLLFKTIVSRCKIIRFMPLSRKEAEDYLQKDYQLDRRAAHFLAYFSEGRIGTALRLKDGGILEQKQIIIDAFVAPGRLDTDRLSLENKENICRALNILASWFRDLYLIKTGIAHTQLINFDRVNELSKSMQRYSFSELEGALQIISDSLLYLEQNVNPRLLLANLKAALWKN